MGQRRDVLLCARERELIARIRDSHDDREAVIALRAHCEAQILERIAVWLDDRHVTLLEDDESDLTEARARFEHTQSIWRPRHTGACDAC